MKKNFIQHKNNKGFTIIETLVAIFVLLISTTGPLAFTQGGLRSSFLARDQVTAFYLAQESIESIKNIRDNNLLQGVDWLSNLENCISGIENTKMCNIGLSGISGNTEIQSCVGIACSPLRYDTNTYKFTQSQGEISRYTRTVYITQITNEELQVIVEVSWTTSSFAPKRIVVQENIFKKY